MFVEMNWVHYFRQNVVYYTRFSAIHLKLNSFHLGFIYQTLKIKKYIKYVEH